MMTTIRMIVARIRGFLRSKELDRDFDEELASHLAMAEEAKMRQGMTRREARRQARVELGGLTQLREASRAARGLPWLGTFWLDIKLGLRMLRKSWGLALVGGLAMTVAIGIGATVFAFFEIALSSTLPLDEGDRVIALQTWDERAQRALETSVSDFERWRDRLRSVEAVGGFQTIERNLIVGAAPPHPVTIAEMTASGFQLARVAPLWGRPLTAEDELATADPVVVIGYDVWRSRFAADPGIVGRTVQLDGVVHSVVGVMPEDFGFPVNHRFWTPLRPDRSVPPGQERPFDVVFARLVPGATRDSAGAELTTLGLLPTATHDAAHLHPRVVPYVFAFDDESERQQARWISRIILFFVTLLLIPPCANIAILVYARTVTRQEEFAARYVLGASRGRIVSQVFVEVLVLATAAAVLALVLVRMAARQLQRMNPEVPFWVDFSLSPGTVLFTAGLTVLAGLIAGAVPALRATGGGMQAGLRALSSRTGMRLGATWTTLVVAQVAFSAAALPPAIEMAWGTLRTGVLGPGFAAGEYLTAKFETSSDDLDLDAVQTELVRQLRAEPGNLGVAVAAEMPGKEPWATIEVEGMPLQDIGIFAPDTLIRFNHVDDAFFDVFDVPILLGRGFETADFAPREGASFQSARPVVIVNRTFAEKIMGTESPLGRRIRYYRPPGEADAATPESASTWYEIVGVVADRPAPATHGTMYHPMTHEHTRQSSLALHAGPSPVGVADRLREIATALDPTLRVEEIQTLDAIYRQQAIGNNMGVFALAAVVLSVLMLSAAGIYALMAFTVNQRRREIGIRSALGAGPHSLLAGIFKRAFGQLALGATGGVLVALLLGYYLPIEILGGWNVPGVVPAAAALMMVIGLLATAGPARRGLRVDPMQELREG